MERLIDVFLLYVVLLKHQCNSALPAKSNVFTLFKTGSDLPGPSMSFQKRLTQDVLQFEFKTHVENALVLYQDDEGLSNFMELCLQGGRIHSSFRMGRSEKESMSIKKYNDFKWHSVRIKRNTSSTSVELENEVLTTLTRNEALLLSLTSNLQIGGFSLERLDDPNGISHYDAWSHYVDDEK